MLRKGLVALMMGVICAGSAVAADSAARKPNPGQTGLAGWLKSAAPNKDFDSKFRKPGSSHAVGPNSQRRTGGVNRAAVKNGDSPTDKVRQTAGGYQGTHLPGQQTATATPQTTLRPVPVENAPVLPDISSVSGPQYFSAMPAESSNAIPVHPSSNWQTYQDPTQVQNVSQGVYTYPASSMTPAGPVDTGGGIMTPQPSGGYSPMSSGGQYPQTGAALYPAPVPGIPQQMGGAAIMNQAFHPHEMLYSHEYHAMYPPYYYKVNGRFMMTPFGMWSHEDWKLQGTRVDVKYNSHISPFTLFHPPFHR